MNILEWTNALNHAIEQKSPRAVAALFQEDSFWRDFLALDWTLQTIESAAGIGEFVAAHAESRGFSIDVLPGEDREGQEGFIAFDTAQGRGRGYVRLKDGKGYTFFAALEELKGHEEPLGKRRPTGLISDPDGRNWKRRYAEKTDRFSAGESPYVLVVGGGQAGLALGARLEMLGIPYLIIDKHPKVGDQWRSRYASLTLHDPVWYDHLPYIQFPDFWPVFTPKDKMGDWLEKYADAMELAIWTSTECQGATYDSESGTWSVLLSRNGQELTLSPPHLVMAVGNAGFPRIPEIEGQDVFEGEQLHSSQYKSGKDQSGRRVVIVGANNSAHDIAADLVENGAEPIMIQRSSTLIIQQSTFTEVLLKPLFSQEAVDGGITTDRADILLASNPLKIQERRNKEAWDRIRIEEARFYDRLASTGFQIDFGDDGTGLMKYQRSASGYYIDVGACEMIVDGRIGIRSGATIARLVPQGLELDTGEIIEADAIVYATGFGSMEEWVERLISADVAGMIGKCWGYGSGAKGDPGPWEGELRNMWKPTSHEGLWFMGGNLAQTRFYSRLLALQLKARAEGLLSREPRS